MPFDPKAFADELATKLVALLEPAKAPSEPTGKSGGARRRPSSASGRKRRAAPPKA